MKTHIKLDATALSKSSCLLRMHYFAGLGVSSKYKSPNLTFGVAFHKFAELLETKPVEDALLEARRLLPKIAPTEQGKDHLNQSHLTTLCSNFYDTVFANDNFKTVRVNDTPCVELKFAIPVYVDDQYEVSLCGTIDRIARVGQHGAYVIEDYKTTSSWNKQAYFEGYELSGQLHIYQTAVRMLAALNPGSIYETMINSGPIGCVIHGIFLNKDIDKCEFLRSKVFYFSNERTEFFFKNVLIPRIKMYIDYLHNNPDPTEVKEGIVAGLCDSAKYQDESKLYRCEYFGICNAPDKIAREMLIDRDFSKREYNPLNFNNETIPS